MSHLVPADYDIHIHEAAKFEDTVRLYARTADGRKPISVSGHTADMHVRARVADDTSIVALSTTNGQIVIDENEVHLELPADVVSGLVPWETPAYYDLRLTSPQGEAFFVLRGRARFVPRVTR